MPEKVHQYLGTLIAVPLAVLLTFFPLHDGGIFPDPFETLFDWAGMFVSMTWLAVLWFVINYCVCFFVAGCLDCCSLKRAFAWLVGCSAVCSAAFLFPSYNLWWNRTLIGLTGGLVLFVVYVIARIVARHFRRSFRKSTSLVAEQ